MSEESRYHAIVLFDPDDDIVLDARNNIVTFLTSKHGVDENNILAFDYDQLTDADAELRERKGGILGPFNYPFQAVYILSHGARDAGFVIKGEIVHDPNALFDECPNLAKYLGYAANVCLMACFADDESSLQATPGGPVRCATFAKGLKAVIHEQVSPKKPPVWAPQGSLFNDGFVSLVVWPDERFQTKDETEGYWKEV